MPEASLRIAGAERTATLLVMLDGVETSAFAGETVAGLMLRLGRRTMRRTARRHEARSYFCGMGACFECVMDIDGRAVQACLTYLTPGMRITTPGAMASVGAAG